MLTFVIVHYNTPKLTKALVYSILKHHRDCEIYIFDNSDKYPFNSKFDNVKVIDNTQGQIINFDKWLGKYKDRSKSAGRVNSYASAKHCYSIQKCIEIVNKNFILLDSDVLLKKNVEEIVDNKYVCASDVESCYKRPRCLPYICYINVEKYKELRLSFFDEKRMHGLYYSKNGEGYDTGASFYEDIKSLSQLKRINHKDYVEHYKAGSWLDSAVSAHKYKQISSDAWLTKHKSLWNTDNSKMDKNNNVIYTCITGGYDVLNDPIKTTEGFDYVCFTDNLNVNTNVWELRPLPMETEGLSNVKKQRYVKINPHKVLPEYETSIWVDGNLDLYGGINKFVEEQCKDSIICIPKHPVRNCIYDEMIAIYKSKKDTMEKMKPQADRYMAEGFPKHFGLVQTNIIYRKHNNPEVVALMNLWWSELKNGSHRDQMSFNYAVWKLKFNKLVQLDKRTDHSKYFMIHKHTKSNFAKQGEVTANIKTVKKFTANKYVYQPQKIYKKPVKNIIW